MAWRSDVKAAVDHLTRVDPRLAALIGQVGPCRLKPEPAEPYEALVRSVAHQQVHARAAEAILQRFLNLYEGYFPVPLLLLATPEAMLRAVGFSDSKATAIRAIARGAHDGVVPTRAACARLSDEQLIERLTTLRGVGRWTVEMLLIFTLGRKDVLPVNDFGVREGYRLLYGLDKQPTPKELQQAGELWRPWRTVATWYLWQATTLPHDRFIHAPVMPSVTSQLTEGMVCPA